MPSFKNFDTDTGKSTPIRENRHRARETTPRSAQGDEFREGDRMGIGLRLESIRATLGGQETGMEAISGRVSRTT